MTRYCYTMDGRSSMEFIADLRSPREQLAHLLGLLRPGKRSTFTLAPMPDDADFVRYLRAGGSTEFLQCAGTQDAMTIEWRRLDEDGEERLYTIGHGGPRDTEPAETIEFYDGQRRTSVYPDEIFAHEEATDIFDRYRQSGLLPDGYSLRAFDLTRPTP